jgi:hypothetical protein
VCIISKLLKIFQFHVVFFSFQREFFGQIEFLFLRLNIIHIFSYKKYKIVFVIHKESRRIWEDNIKMDLQEVGWGHGLD